MNLFQDPENATASLSRSAKAIVREGHGKARAELLAEFASAILEAAAVERGLAFRLTGEVERAVAGLS